MLQAALLSLPDEYREVVVLKDVEGLSVEEIARVLDENVAAVKSRLVEADPVNLVRIDVDTNGGVVLLNGVVPSEAIKQRASDIAWRVPGARVVINDIQVRGGY